MFASRPVRHGEDKVQFGIKRHRDLHVRNRELVIFGAREAGATAGSRAHFALNAFGLVGKSAITFRTYSSLAIELT